MGGGVGGWGGGGGGRLRYSDIASLGCLPERCN